MPTIDQLAPTTAASDTDEFMVSQNGVARSVTRGQVLAGIQPQLSIASGTLLGGPRTGTGGPEQIAIGANLTLNSGTLSAAASPYVMSALPAGNVPAATDGVPISQTGSNVVVTYAQFVSGLPGVANVDGSELLVTATGSTAQQRLADFAASTLPLAGGTLSGTLLLAGNLAANGNASISGGLSVGGGTIGLPTYSVAALPPSTIGALAYVTNGRKTGEAAGVGTGVLAVGEGGSQWISVMSGTAVLA